MRVRSINENNDWTFGKGRANYRTGSRAISQNVKTRVQSFTNDWYLDIEQGIEWFDLLGRPGTERRILRAIEGTILQTEGVVSIQSLQILGKNVNRGIRVSVSYTDVFGAEISDTLGVNI